jgi:hypothetical protein
MPEFNEIGGSPSQQEIAEKKPSKDKTYIEKLRAEKPEMVEEYETGKFRPTESGWKEINEKADKFTEEALEKFKSNAESAYKSDENPLSEIRKDWPHGSVAFAYSPRDSWGVYFKTEAGELITITPNLNDGEVDIKANSLGDIVVILGTKESEGIDDEDY